MNLYCIQSSFHCQILKLILENESSRSGIAIVKGLNSDFDTEYFSRNNIKVFYFKDSWLFPVFLVVRLFSFVFSKVYVSDIKSVYYQFLIAGLNVKKVFAFDDGASSINLLTLFTNGEVIPKLNGVEGFSSLKVFILKCFGVEIESVKFRFSTFNTIFPFEGSQIRNIKIPKLSSSVLKGKNSCIAFLGGRYVEAGIISEIKYFEAILDVLLLHPSADFIYIPHRAESLTRINSVANLDRRIVIKKLNSGVEEYYKNKLDEIPSDFYSLYSTALFTLPLLYNSVTCHYRTINLNNTCPEHKLAIERAYNLLDKIEYIYAY